ncbi:MAG: Translocation and assembly module subunit TamB [Paracidovorax wautersii]|uniref:Translocation and assembly module subunit TamB n=1 Tax=Paracidovorax wautersii TaxID=1177982 RepID=A0A7V8FPU8_9BURK|nr:MAG: Translocation and assembly module subunit TamB [Paracidovorax wautersii]
MTDPVDPPITDPAIQALRERPLAPPSPGRRRHRHEEPPEETPDGIGHRILRALMWVVPILLLLLVVVVLGLWIWTGSQRSLAQAITLAQRFVPAASALQATGVEGSLRHGGRIASLRWTQPDGVSVAADGLQIAWQPLALLTGTVRVNTLAAERVQVVDRTPAPANPEPSQPLKSLVLPVRIEVPQIRLGHFGWDEPESFAFDTLEAGYTFNGLTHELKIDQINLANGQYSLHARMASQAPMALAAELQGRLQAPMPEGEPPLPLVLQAKVDGPLELLQITAQAEAELKERAAADTGVGSAAPPSGTAPPSPAPAPALGTLPRAVVHARVAPWQAGLPVQQADVALSHINLRAFLPSLPTTLLDGQASITPRASDPAAATPAPGATEPAAAGQQLDIVADIRNSEPGPWDRQRLPLARIQVQGDWRHGPDGQAANVQQLLLALGGGELSGSGRFSLAPAAATPPPQTPPTAAPSAAEATPPAAPPAVWQAQADLRLHNVNPQALHSTLAAAPLSGTLAAHSRPATAAATQPGVDFDVNITGKPPARGGNLLWIQQLVARGAWADDAVTLQRLRLASNQARVEGSGSYRLAAQTAAAKLDLSIPGAQGRIDGSIGPSQGKGDARITLANASQTLAWARRLPGMARLLNGQQLRGNARLDAQWQGGWQRPTVNAALDVPQLALTQNGQPPMALSGVQARLQGRLDQASLSLQGRAQGAGQTIDLLTQLSGGNKAASGQPARWVADVQTLRVRADDPTAPAGAAPSPWTLETTQPLNLSWQNQTLQASAGSARLLPPTRIVANSRESLPITWDPVRLRTTAQGLAELRTAGRIQGLPFAWANALSGGKLAASGISGDLALDADWNVQLDQNLQARIAVGRASGDLDLLSQDAMGDAFALSADQVKTPPGRGTTKITVIDPQGGSGTASSTAPAAASAAPAGRRITAGIKTMSLVVTANNTQLDAQLAWDTERLGQANGQLRSPLTRAGGAWQWAPDAPLTGQLKASLTRLGIWSVLAPPGWRMRGQLEADATFAGTRSAPLLNGTLRGSGLALRSVLDGVELANGQFQATLAGTRLVLDRFSLDGAAGGNVTAQGQADWSSGQPDMRIEARINQLRVTNRADRQVTVSGDLLSTLRGQDLALTGTVNVDRALIILPESSTPTLGDDVHVIDPTEAEAQAAARQPGTQAIQPRVDVTLDLGRDFKLQGYGINTQLRGRLRAVLEGGTPRVTGDINTVDGEYRAYGQWLDITRGVIRFSGPYDNPSLDVLAIRPRLTERVGVQVTGPAISPVIRLYSESAMTDSEKLSWLLLGRSGASGGAEAAMLQQAAAAMLSGGAGGAGIAGVFGLDQLSVGGSKNEAGETEASVTVGKQLARDLYVTYERTLSGALGTLYVFYELSRRWTLRGQSGGEDQAVDLIFTLPYD